MKSLSKYITELPFTAIAASSLLGYYLYHLFIHLETDNLTLASFLNNIRQRAFVKISVCLAADYRLGLDVAVGWVILTHEYALTRTIPLQMVVCLGLMSFWKVNLCLSLKSFDTSNMLCPKLLFL